MKVSYFLCYVLVLTLGWMHFYASVREVYSGIEDAKVEIAQLKKEIKDLRIARLIDEEHFLEFRQTVATLIPEALKKKGGGEKGYPYRNLASIVTKNDVEGIRKTIAKTIFETGKQNFRKRNYVQANRAFKQIIDRFGYTPFVVESYFLMAEGYFQSDELEECTSTIETMVELFPNHELTGFALIRLGRIYEKQNRNEEAVDIYRTVLRSFPQRDVASQAKSSLRGMEL